MAWFGPWFRNWREQNSITQKQVAALFPSKTGGLTGCVANWELGFNMPTPEQFNLIRNTFGLPFDSVEEAEREVLGQKISGISNRDDNDRHTIGAPKSVTVDITAPATEAAKQWEGWGTALKPSWESITVAQKPIQSSSDVEFFFVSLLHTLKTELCQYQSFALIAENHLMSSRSESGEVLSIAQWTAEKSTNIQADLSDLMGMLQLGLETNINWSTVSSWLNTLGALYKAMNTCTIETASSLTIELKTLNLLEWASILQSIMQSNGTSQNGQSANVCTAEILFSALELKLRTIQILSVIDTATLRGSDGGFAPNLDPIVVARKPLVGTVAENVLAHGTGGLNVDGCRVVGEGWGTRTNSPETKQVYGDYAYIKTQAHDLGRWPANFIHDGSEEVVGLFPMTGKGNGGEPYNYAGKEYNNKDSSMFNGDKPQAPSNFNDNGSAARYFYCAKASKADRDAGLDSIEIISIFAAWEKEDLQVRLLVDTATSPPRVTVESTVQHKNCFCCIHHSSS